MRGGRRTAPDGKPGPGRRPDDADRDRRRLPRLQRQQRPARSSPTYQISVEVPDANAAGRRQRGAGRRRARRRHRDDHPGPGRGRLGAREARPEARPRRRPAARGLDLHRPRPLGAGVEVPRDRARAVRRGAAPRAARSGSLLRAPSRSSSTSSSTPSRSRPAAAIQQNQLEFGNALAGRGAALNAAIGELPPLLDRLIPVMRNLSSPQTDLAGFFRGLEQAAAEVAPVAQTQADMFVALDQTFTALAAVARPFIQDTITTRRRGRGRGDRAAAADPSLPAPLGRPVHRPAAGAPRRWPAPRRTLASRVHGRRRRCCARRRCSTRSCRRRRRPCCASGRTRTWSRASTRCQRHGERSSTRRCAS